jgi:hypothetical protein
MKTWKNFWAAVILSGGWSAFLVFVETMRYTDYNALATLVGAFIAFIATYQILRILQYVPDVLEKQETKGRSQRYVDDLVQQMDRDQLAALRDRLADLEEDEFESIGTLLDNDRGKRKNR